jgi:uncharacterized lipoprotein YmbA
MKKITAVRCAIGCAVALALGACQSGPTRIHDLEPVGPATHINSYQAPPLRVDTLSVPAGWDRIEMLSPSASGELEISDFNHWSAPLAQIARQTLSDDLDQRLPPGSVIYPRLPKPDRALGINVDILEFTLTTKQATMRASWLIVPTVGAQNTTRSVASVQTSMNSTEPKAVAHAWSLLMGQLADHIAADAASFTMP